MAKRALDASPADAKRVRTSLEQEGSKSTAGDDSVFERIKDVLLPAKVKALPHVMSLIARLAMTPEEALKEALATHDLDWMRQLLFKFDCDLTETMVQAAATNQLDIVELVRTDGFDIHNGSDLFAMEVTKKTNAVLEKGVLAAVTSIS
ncbi:hypothetical protein P3T76_005559 [Phytophthora citrophthora]|uniref:Uncharacterized protein n=1 Tax=Phytophthora citrophthora TaxID=4793 RepID=A0AAD9LPQ3_9STRA|nr:hypothetical protein P3T76_005559 [Phytophthora citrophthora]